YEPPRNTKRSYFPGYGKMFSRFLYLFPESFEEALRASNNSLTTDVLAELGDDANFNANLHPQLLPAEISYPIGEGRGQGESISTADLVVVKDPVDPHGLALRHEATGKRVFPVDLGFLSLRLRPPLYRLLAALTPAPSFGLPAPEAPKPRADSQTLDGTPGVKRRPRVYLGRHLVLHRRSWLVPASHFPHRITSESDAAYFERIERWRRQHEIPSEVYVRIHDPVRRRTPPARHQEAEAMDDKEQAELANREEKAASKRRGSMKPQYIDFHCPLLLDLFAHMAPPNQEFTLILEERLPADDALPTFENQAFATEVILQLNIPL
ncbi:MAG: lantibiotic dehydratase, partial [Acidobacteriota bacterium]